MGNILDDNVHIEPENDITTAQAGNRNVKIDGDLVTVLVKTVSKGNKS